MPAALRRLLPAVAAAPILLAAPAVAAAEGETVTQALCRLIEESARTRAIPVPFLTRLIYRESAFRVTVVSPAGAQGVAQFMPGTARDRGLLDPFDPEQAIPHAAHLLSDLRRQFGNLGLAAAAYNGGAGRVSAWLAGRGGLPAETRAYVLALTGRPAEDWRTGGSAGVALAPEEPAKPEPAKPEPGKPAASTDAKPDAKGPAAEAKTPAPEAEPAQTCLQVAAALRVPSRGDRFALPLDGGPTAPWGVQLAGNFSKARALESFSRTRERYAGVIGTVRPMIIGTRLRFRGSGPFYRVRIPAESRVAADTLCERIRKAGGACIVLRT